MDYDQFDLGDIKLLSGKILKSAKLAYRTYGVLNKNSVLACSKLYAENSFSD